MDQLSHLVDEILHLSLVLAAVGALSERADVVARLGQGIREWRGPEMTVDFQPECEIQNHATADHIRGHQLLKLRLRRDTSFLENTLESTSSLQLRDRREHFDDFGGGVVVFAAHGSRRCR